MEIEFRIGNRKLFLFRVTITICCIGCLEFLLFSSNNINIKSNNNNNDDDINNYRHHHRHGIFHSMNLMFRNATAKRQKRNHNPEKHLLKEKCVQWHEENLDDWWQLHPDWEVSYEDDSITCLSPMKNLQKAAFFRKMHAIQFGTYNDTTNSYSNPNCSRAFNRMLVSSGYAATVVRITAGFWHAFHQGIPTVRSKHWIGAGWMYSSQYNASKTLNDSSTELFGECPTNDMFCYFLNFTNCDYIENKENEIPRNSIYRGQVIHTPVWMRDDIVRQQYAWMIAYFVRPKQETRYQLHRHFQQVAAPKIPPKDESCIALHVRRTDALTELKFGNLRALHFVSEYLQAAGLLKTNDTENNNTIQQQQQQQQPIKNIVLLTDDESTIKEAETLHSQFHWYYIRRKRYYGTQKNNRHIPSGKPAIEFLNILADFRMAQHCTTLVHGISNMVEFIVQQMDVTQDKFVRTILLDQGRNYRTHPPMPANEFYELLEAKIGNATTTNQK